MNRTFLIFGVKRTGNHAIINWLIPQIGDVVRFFNDQHYFFVDSTKFDEHHMAEHVLQLGVGRIFINNEKKRHNEVYLEEYSNVDNIISFEGLKFGEMFPRKDQWINDFNVAVKRFSRKLEISDDITYIIILRNPWNFVASQIKWREMRPEYDRYNIDIDVWEEFYGLYLEKNQPNAHFIIYDKWFIDINYRKKISKELGIKFNDINLNKVATTGGGSTFDKMEFDGKAQEMNVLFRYKQMMDNKKMLNFIESEKGVVVKNKWNHLCDLEKTKNLKIK